MKKLNLKRTEKRKTNPYGMPLSLNQKKFIERQLELLQEICPSSSRLDLTFSKTGSRVKGHLNVRSYQENFTSVQLGSDPIQAFFQLQKDLEKQLLDWKKGRFHSPPFSPLCLDKQPIIKSA